MTTAGLADEIQAMKAQYPDARSAVLPALRRAQEVHGWLSEPVLRELADALDVTPAYCHAVASFYDQFHLEPRGRHVIEICTNISCALGGARGVLEAFERALEIHAGETTPDGTVTLRTVECLGSCGWATALLVDGRQRMRIGSDDVATIVEELRDGVA